MGSTQADSMDEIDRHILGVLAKNPRTPYSDIADELEAQGYEMSSAGIRYRVQNLLDVTSTFFMLNPNEHDWLVLRLALSVTDDADAKAETLARLEEMSFWFVGSGFGSFDMYAVATAPSTGAVDALLNDVRSIETIEDVEYFLETERTIEIDNYLPVTGSI